jgi:predicted DsbA family dithiol-disulfide isomerase
MRNTILRTAITILVFATLAAGQGKKLAVVNGEVVTEDQLKKAAQEDLENLDARKAQAEMGFLRDQQAIYEKTLESMVDNKLIEAEARKRNVTPQLLVTQEVDSKVSYVSDQDVNAFYEANKARINISGADAMRQIRAYLMEQRRDGAYKTFIEKLKKDYKVETYLEPLRVEIATQGFPSKGAAAAPVTIVEFSDFECPFCAGLFPTLKQVESRYADKVRIVFRQFPLTAIHPRAQKAAEASLCANEQQKFWEMHDAMFLDNKNLEVDALKQKATTLKLDVTVFNACIDSAKHAETVRKDIAEGVRLGITGTPAMFINGRFINGNVPLADLSKVIDDELQRKK